MSRLTCIALLGAIACANDPDVSEWSCLGTGTCDGDPIAHEAWQMLGTRREVDDTVLWWASMCIEVHSEDGCTVLVCGATCIPEGNDS